MNTQKFLSVMCRVVVMLSFLVASTTAQENLRREGRDFMADIDKEFKVQPGGNLVMTRINGDVTIITSDKNIVKIHEILRMDVYTESEAKAVFKSRQSQYEQQGNTIRITSEGRYRNDVQSDYQITLPMTFNVDVSTSGGDISVIDLKGTVELSTSGGDIELNRIDGVVDANTSGGDIQISKATQRVTARTSGGDIGIIDVDGIADISTSGGDIMVRNNKAKVTANTSGGDIELENVGAEIIAHTSGGDIDVNGGSGDIEVNTSGGDVNLKSINGTVRARTSGGDIRAYAVMNGIDVSTSGGDIELQDIQGFIEGSTSGGDIEAEMTLKDFSKDHHVELQSFGGDITLWIPEKLPATINAEIELSGYSSRSERYNIISDFPITIDQMDESRGKDYITGQGKINGGGDLINLTTSNGNIYIKKLR